MCPNPRNWDRIISMSDVNDKTQELTSEINKALDACAPLKQFKVSDNYRPGLTEKAECIMRERERLN